MPKKLAPQPLRIVRMQTAQGDETGRDDPLDKIVQTIKQKHDDVERYDNTIEFSTGKIQYTFRMEKIKNFIVSTTVIKYVGDYKINNIIDDYESSFNLFDSTSPNMPSNVLSTFIIFVLPQQSEHQSEGLVEQFSQHLGKTNLGIGITRGCLLSIFETDKEDQFNRTYLISPLNDREPPDKLIDDMLDDVKKLVVYTAELSRLYSGCVTFFSALKPGEREISEKTEDLLWKLIGPETVDLGTLESGLGYIMERESSLSAMISTMQMNRIEAESIVSKIEYTFMRMDERRVENNPMNLEMEAETYRKISKSFED